MVDTNTLFLIGLVLFFVGGAALFLVYFYYIYRGRGIIANYRRCESDTWCIQWTATRWLYPLLFIGLLLMGVLYLSMFLGQGIALRPNLLMVMWERWVILTIVAFLYSVALNYALTGVPKKRLSAQLDEQAFFMVFLYTFAYAALIGAVLSQAFQTRLMWTIVSIVAFVLAILFYIYPSNKFNCAYHIASRFSYYKLFFVFLVLAYVYNLIIYFLAASNEYSDVLDFHQEVIAYLVGDTVFMLLFALVVLAATFLNLNDTLQVTHRATGTIIYAAPNKKGSLSALL